ncbi:MAG: hypothetical protein H6P99_1462 [Holophagaceae bacterium]|nr:hypothetical protein [Holophagaceae bacterium]
MAIQKKQKGPDGSGPAKKQQGPDGSGPFACQCLTRQHLSAELAAGIGTLLSQVAKVSQGPSLHLSGYRVMKLTKIIPQTGEPAKRGG